MNIIITGACGHIGTYVTDNLYKIKKIKNIYLIDNLNSKNYNFFFKKRNNKKIKYFFKDLTNNSSLKQFKKIDILIHFASMTNAADSFKIKKQMYYNNIKCFENVVNFCIKKKSS